MTYAKKLSNMGELTLSPHIGSIEKLKPGGVYILEGNPTALSTFRYYFYTWVDISSLSGIYRVRKRGEEKVEIERVAVPELRGRHLTPLTNIEEFVVEHLSEIELEEEVTEIINSALGDGEIKEEDVGEIWKEWKGGGH